ncbi:MAG: sigma-70 family RNA polymerase sigma factor [Kordiimonadaceae bacterium]|nr:sigma-70 family RNA polymerase sigma factor [Kordiimonadaceae bacterium]
MTRSAMDSLDDETLVVRVTQANRAAFGVLTARHGARYRALAFRFVHDMALAEDLVQEAFVKLWTHASLFDASKSKFTTWFHRIVVNRCLDEKRKRRILPLPEGFDVVDSAPAVDDTLEVNSVQNRLKAVLGNLPERQRTAVVLNYFDGMSNQEAADVMDLNIKAYESLLVRARTNMRKKMMTERADLMSAFA